MTSRHIWHFFRAGGVDQVHLGTAADLAVLEQLDQKLWVALSCPTRGLEFDTHTLDLIDTDHDGRIRAPEVITALKWCCELLRDPALLTKSPAALPLTAINDAVPEGQRMLASARQILLNLGKLDADAISVEDTTDTVRIFAQTRFNGDGIVPVESATDEVAKTVIGDIIACLGGEPDRSGKPGVTLGKLEQFFTEAQAFSDWHAAAEQDTATILPLGDATAGAAVVVRSLKAKIDDYFARSRLAAYDARALTALNRQESEYLAIAAKDLNITVSEVVGFPLARIEPNRPLPLTGALNPAWVDQMRAFREQVVTPLLGEREELTESDWATLHGRLAPYEAWQSAKRGAAVEALGVARVREILAGEAKQTIVALIAEDQALEPQANAIDAVDRLTRYTRDMYKFLLNFVSFSEFYSRREKAVFQAGRLYLDQRSCDLCIRVEDVARHAAMAPLSQMYLVYCDCTRKATGEKMTIAAAMTAGDSDNLMVGRNGVFYDRQDHDWDATITKIVENPISIRQAFWSPYKRLIRWIQEQIAKRAAAADAASQNKLEGAATQTASGAQAGKAPAPAEPKKLDIGIIAALGIALGFLATAFASLLGWLTNAPKYMIPVYILVILLLISGPSMVIAWLKLRLRNIGPILDANGWAVNARAKINIPFGRSLTAVAALPPGAKRDLVDPYAEKHTGRWITTVVAVLIVVLWALWYFGVTERVAPDVLPKSGYVERRQTALIPAPTDAAPAPNPSSTP